MIKFYMQQHTEGSGRLFVNIPKSVSQAPGLDKQMFMLDYLSVWGGHDRMQTLDDGSKTLSWEFGPTLYPIVQNVVEDWRFPGKCKQHTTPNWQADTVEHPFVGM